MAMKLKLAVVGCGYVGTVVASAFARLDHHVTGVEVDEGKLEQLRAGRAPFHEPMLDVLVRHGVARGKLDFTADPAEAVPDADLIFLCLASPNGGKGRADLSQIERAIDAMVPHLRAGQVLVAKSTMPVGANDRIEQLVRERSGLDIPLVVNPEFLREGSAVIDFLHPDRIVLGSDSSRALELVQAAYRPIIEQVFEPGMRALEGESPVPRVVVTNRRTAEIIKFAANTFLASRISLINEIAEICEAFGGDVEVVASAVGMDARIGPHFLQAGLGWGGSCFDKDLAIFARQARDAGVEPMLIEAAGAANRHHRRWAADLVAAELGGLVGRRVAVLGLAFKPDTDDVRDSPAVELAARLAAAGAEVRAHDPAVRDVPGMNGVEYCSDPLVAASGADAVVLATEWSEYAAIDFDSLAAHMRGTLVVDGRNFWPADRVVAAGLRYQAVGRPGATDRVPPSPRAASGTVAMESG